MSTAFDDNDEPVIPRERSDRPGRIRILSAILWPGFIVAGIATTILFAIVDPSRVVSGTQFADASTFGIYSVCFLSLWSTISIAAICTLWLLKPGLETATPLPRRGS